VSAEFRPIKTRGTTGFVIQRIAMAIRKGDLRVGDRLPSERDLAAQLQVSRQTVRNAVQALVEADVLAKRSGAGVNNGAIVCSDVIPAELTGEGADPLEPGEIAAVLEARRVFEPPVAVLAGFAMNHDDYATLRSIIVAQADALDDIETVRRLDFRFHLTIAHTTHNPAVVALMQTLQGQLEITRLVVPTYPEEQAETVAMHERTLEAIASRDPARIEATMDEHLRMLENAWERYSGRALPRPMSQLARVTSPAA
jgi:GntR family transcriptional regulator, transcriptional repressor for pyruvate dehydrogenase complex